MALWRRAAPHLLFGDYHPLTPFHKSAAGWLIRQFDQPECGNGMVQAIRFPAAAQESQAIWLKGVDPAATYRFEQGETGETLILSGATLAAIGFAVSLAQRSAVIWFYQRI
jgi:alpha-galactosidase